MIVKMTSKNQITIPKKLMMELPEVQYFDIDLKDGILLLRPVQIYDTDLDQIRFKINIKLATNIEEQPRLNTSFQIIGLES